ncbi:hypothetical protein AALO_G00247070 [Alosa alosa]|uniref:Transmembrane protein n=1 Tax=Alosa alosa TaxID=278164 RepID=A0AAV6FXK6_9TELE|nr:hypothetical protein AALO_G00247070 [Alosa alosa]
MVCADYGMGHCKPPTWSKVGMEIMPGDLNKVFLAKDSASSAVSLESGWGTELFFLGLVCVITVVICLWISKRMNKQDDDKANKEKLPEEKGLHEKILGKMGEVEERIRALEEFKQSLNLRKSKDGGLKGF